MAIKISILPILIGFAVGLTIFNLWSSVVTRLVEIVPK